MSVLSQVKRIFIKIKEGKFNIVKYYEYLYKCPIDEEAILLCSQHGKDINGNMFYLLKELQNDEYSSYKKYVAVDKKHYLEFKEKFDTYGFKDYILLRMDKRSYLKALATSKYLFTDTSFLSYFVKRDEQIYFNTWHGIPFKTLGKRIKDDFYLLGNVQRNFLMSNYLLYPCNYMKKHMLDDYMVKNISSDDTKVVMSGYPRSEVFFDYDRRKELRKKLDIDKKTVIMYMPTWRGSYFDLDNNSVSQINQVKKYLKEIDSKLSDNQIMYVNFHPFLKDKVNISSYKRIKPFDKKYETYDYLNMADILITDYSSIFFDFAVTKRKIILFAYDKEQYFNDRGTYFDYDELPFPKAYNVSDLIKEINNKKKNNYNDFLDTFCKYEGIGSSKKILDLVLFDKKDSIKIEDIPNNNKPNVFIYSGNLNKNGITSSLLSLLNNVDLDKYNYYITYYGSSVKENKEIIRNLDSRIGFISINNTVLGTLREVFLLFLYKLKLIGYNKLNKKLESYYERELMRCYGNAKIDTFIHYTGYGDSITRLIAKSDANSIIYVHSDMRKEIKMRKNQNPETLRNVYREYDHVVVVADYLKDTIKEICGSDSNVSVINNIIDYDNIVKKGNMDVYFDKNTISNKSLDEIVHILDSNSKKICAVGRFSPEKGYDRLIDEFSKIDDDAYLIIIGGFGPLFNSLKKKVDNLNCNNIILIYDMSNPFNILSRCDSMIISSYYEGLPMVLFEGAALNKPIVSTYIPSIDDVFKKFGGGLIVSNDNKGINEGLKALINNEVKPLKINFNNYNKNVLKNFDSVVGDCMKRNSKKFSKRIIRKFKKNERMYKLIIIMLSIIVILLLFFSLSVYSKGEKNEEKYNKIISEYKDKEKSKIIDENDSDNIVLEDGKSEFVHNASYRLKLTSPYGDNQGTHPKVLYFEDGWNGYKFWMVFSPYPYSNDKKENPVIKVSNNGINWTEPEGLKNPIEGAPKDYKYQVTYNSDPHLVYIPETDTLECYFRKVDDKNDAMILYRKTTKDGVNWTSKEEITRTTRSEKDYVSPAIIYEDNKYKMWYVDDNIVKYEESEDGYNYSDPKELKIKYTPSSLKTWHLDVIHTDLGYEMITVAYECWEGRTRMQLYYFKSKDGINWSEGESILKASNNSWDNAGLYRSSFLKVDDVYYLYYSGVSKDWARGIGLSYGKDIFNLKGYDKNQE